MTRIRRDFATISLGQIHYRSTDGFSGAQLDPIVLLHQTAESSRIWLDAMPVLGEYARVIAPDTPGFGDSDAPSEPPGADGYARALAELLDEIGISKVNLVGFYTGATIALEFATLYPARVTKLVLSGKSNYTAEERVGRVARENSHEPQQDGSHLKYAWDRVAGGITDWATPEQLHEFAVDTLKAGPNYFYGYLAGLDQDVPARACEVTAPTLLMTGRGDPLLKYHVDILSCLRNGREIVMEGAGRMPMVEKPAEYCRNLIEFLKEP